MRIGKQTFRAGALAVFAVGAALALAACTESTEILAENTGANQSEDIAVRGGRAPEGQRRGFTRGMGGGSGNISVNPFLWRAALDTISFMPITSADPFGGAIITDWYAPPETPRERFKINLLILGKELRSGGVKLTVFRQARDESGKWSDAPVENNTALDLENVILTRARELRQEQANQ